MRASPASPKLPPPTAQAPSLAQSPAQALLPARTLQPSQAAGDDGDSGELPVEALGELLAEGYEAQDVPALVTAQAGLSYFALLRDLVRLGEADFAVRLAVLSELAGSDRTRWDPDALARHFVWLNPEARTAVFKSLRKGGWLELLEGLLRLTDRGEALYAVISRVVGITPQEGDLALGVLNVELSRDLGHEQAPALRHLHHNLRRIVDSAEESVRSHSEVRVIEAQARIERNLAWARRARSSMESLNLEDDSAYRLAQQVGQALSELHQWQAVLQRASGDLQAKRIQLGRTGLSLTDVTSFLMRCDTEQLADFGLPLVSLPVSPLFVILDNALSEAEFEFVQGEDRSERTFAVGWTDGPAEDSPPGEPELPEFLALDRFVADIKALATKGGAAKLSALVPRRSWAESAYRLSLLALGETAGEVNPADDGPTPDVLDLQALRGTQFEVLVIGDGFEKDKIFSEVAGEISRGAVRLRQSAAAQP